MTTCNLWDAAKAVIKGKFIATQSYLKKQKTSNGQHNLNLKQLEKEEGEKINRMKVRIKIQAEINEKKRKETIIKINKTKRWFFEETKKN